MQAFCISRRATATAFLVALLVIAASGAARAGSTTFLPTGGMATARAALTATLLGDGTVLVVGGSNDNGSSVLASAEIYNPATHAFSATRSMATARDLHTATLLRDGTVLVVGGWGGAGAVSSAEIYNPATGAFSATGGMATPRYGHTATLLSDGTVLVVGGQDDDVWASSTAEIYNPATRTFSATGQMTTGRYRPTLTLLNDGTVLVAGGSGYPETIRSEIYDPVTHAFSSTGTMATVRSGHTATLLRDGTVLVAGGSYGTQILSSSEIYNPATHAFSGTGSMSAGRNLSTATLLDDGTVLMAGGGGSVGTLSTAEIYSPVTHAYSATGGMTTARIGHKAALLGDGTVLVVGGDQFLAPGGDITFLASAEIYGGGTPPTCGVDPRITYYYQGDLVSAVPQPYFGRLDDARCETSLYGCYLLTASNMFRSFGDTLLAPYVPAVVNETLKAAGDKGYANICDLTAERVPTGADYRVQLVFGMSILPGSLGGVLEQHFCQDGNRAILRLNEYVDNKKIGSHFVLVTGQGPAGDWTVFDPGWRNPSPVAAATSLNGHLNGFTTYNSEGEATFRRFEVADLQVFAFNPTPAPGSLSVKAFSPVELLITDPRGRHLGWSDGADVFEIPQGSYFRDLPLANADGDGPDLGEVSGPKTAYIAFPADGGYHVDVKGIGLGTFSLEFRSVSADGSVQQRRLNGVANVGSAATFTVGYSSSPGSSLDASRVATIDSTLADITNYFRLGLISNTGIAQSLSQKLQAAQAATGSARVSILRAFKAEVSAQSGIHIAITAGNVLSQEADSLISQIQ